MKISVFGMGYVGCISAACLASAGHSVIGVDIKENKIEVLRSGKAPIYEKGLDEIISNCIENGSLKVTTSSEEAVSGSDVSLISVGTPQGKEGKADLTFLKRVISDIASLIVEKEFHVFIIRSTIFPGTTQNVLIPLIEITSGKKYLEGFDVIYNPEFLREGSGVDDYYNPPYTLLGGNDEVRLGSIRDMYSGINGAIITTQIEIAEMIKFVNNSFHAMKVCFGNEVGSICKEIGLDSHDLMNIFCLDTKLNLSSYYLKPGFAYGGSCLPKDLSELTDRARGMNVSVPLLDSINMSNNAHIMRGFELIEGCGKKRIGFLGLAFKTDTDDLRNSPMKILVDMLTEKGYDVRIFDEKIYSSHVSRIKNDIIEMNDTYLSDLLTNDVDELVRSTDVIVIGKKDPEYLEIIRSCGEDMTIIDLVRISKEEPSTRAKYVGIGW